MDETEDRAAPAAAGSRAFRGPRLDPELAQLRLTASSAFSHTGQIVNGFLLGEDPQVTDRGVVLTNAEDPNQSALLSGEAFTYDAATGSYRGTLETVTFFAGDAEVARLDGFATDGAELTAILAEGSFARLVAEAQLLVRGSAEADTVLGTPNADVMGLGDGDDAVRGEGGDDRILGGAGDDALAGGDGDDDLRGNAGDDTLEGGAGDDRLIGHAGDDLLVGGSGDDLLRGFAGDDALEGGSGNDLLAGNAGSDTLSGGAGDDTLRGWRDDDVLRGGEGDDRLAGHAGDDALGGGSGNDTLRGGRGDDTLDGGQGDDLLIGGPGNDSFLFEAGDGDDRIFAFNYLECEIVLDLSALAPDAQRVALTEQTEQGAVLVYGEDSVALIGRGFGELTLEDLMLTILD